MKPLMLLTLSGGRASVCSCGRAHSSVQPPGGVEHAAARQEPPPRCLLLLAEGVLEAVEAAASLRALREAARDGCCGFVALRAGTGCEGEAVAQLLGSQPLSSRFLGLRSAVLSDSPAARDAGAAAAAHVQPVPSSEPGPLAAELARLLGVGGGGDGGAPFDLLLLHLRPPGAPPWTPDAAAATAWLADAVLASLLACPAARGSLYCLLLLRPAAPLPPPPPPTLPPHLLHLRPTQSVTASARGAALDEHALLCIHSLEAVVRRDAVSAVSAAEVAAHGGRGVVLADDVLAELAFKLGKAPKYGA